MFLGIGVTPPPLVSTPTILHAMQYHTYIHTYMQVLDCTVCTFCGIWVWLVTWIIVQGVWSTINVHA